MTILVTDNAIKRIAKILADKDSGSALRVSVEGGGCAGFSYKYNLTDDQSEDDVVIERDGAKLLIDAVSAPFLEGAEIDFVDDLMGQAFQINNPNAVSSCGCGTSFSI